MLHWRGKPYPPLTMKTPDLKPRKLSQDASDALDAMRRMRIGVLSVLLEADQPYSAVVNIHVDDNLRFYFATDRKTRKFKALLAHPHVALNMGFNDEMVNNFQITGKASVVDKAERWQDLFDALMVEKPKDQVMAGLGEMTAHYPFRHFPSNDSAIVVIEPTWIRWFRHPAGTEKPQHLVVLGE